MREKFTIDPKHFTSSEWEEAFNAGGELLLAEENQRKAVPVQATKDMILGLAMSCREKAERMADDEDRNWSRDLESAANLLECIVTPPGEVKIVAPLPVNMDPECIELCNALNRIPGIRTIESCCGHGERPYRVWFVAESLKHLPFPLWCVDECHSGYAGWRVIAMTDCAMSPVKFRIEGPRGVDAYEQSKGLAELIDKTMEEFREQPGDAPWERS